METKHFSWESPNGLWKVKARFIRDVQNGEKIFHSDVDVFKLDKRTGRYERVSGAKKYSNYVEAARKEAHEFVRNERIAFVKELEEAAGDPFAGLVKNDPISISTNDGNYTGTVYFVEQTADDITVLHFVYDQEQVIAKTKIDELYHEGLKRMVYQRMV